MTAGTEEWDEDVRRVSSFGLKIDGSVNDGEYDAKSIAKFA